MRNIVMIGIVVAGGMFLLPKLKVADSSEELVHYPRDLAEIKKLGGFWKLSPEQQAYVRYRYVDELTALMGSVNERMELGRYAGDLAACYTFRTVIKRLQESIDRVQQSSVDPTGEQRIIMEVSVFLGGNGHSNTPPGRMLQRR